MTFQVAKSFQTTTTLTRQVPSNGIAHNSYQNNRPPPKPQGIVGRHDPLYLFGKNKEGDASNKKISSIEESESGEREKKRSKIPFFGRLKRSRNGPKEAEKEQKERQAEPVAIATTASGVRPPKSKKKDPPNPDDLKLMAERARLEAERLDAELTLAKIEKLEQQLVKSKKESEGDSDSDRDVVDDLQYQLDVLKAKLNGDPAPVRKATAQAPVVSQASTVSVEEASTASKDEPVIRVAVEKKEVEVARSGMLEIDDAKVLERAKHIAESNSDIFSTASKADMDESPEFILMAIAPFFDLKVERNKKVDRVELARRGKMLEEFDYSFFEREPPSFDKSAIRRKKLEILAEGQDKTEFVDFMNEFMEGGKACVTQNMIEKANGNTTQLALYSLEYEYYVFDNMDNIIGNIENDLSSILSNQTYFSSMYPKCVNDRGQNKGDDYVSEEPTEAQIEVLSKTILPAVKFSSSSKPQKVPGGYVIKGSHKFDDGDALIQAIDDEIAKSRPNLQDQLTVLYTPSYGPMNDSDLQDMENIANMDMNTIMADPDVLDMFAGSEPILYITGPNIVRDSNPVALAFTSALGLATSWYLSVYPFLLNTQIANRIDADLQLVEANLQPDLSYLTDLSIPLFLSFIGIQLVHEVAHSLTAMAKGVKLSVPVFVPSLITGITSSVTTFKTLPKNKNDMFDIAASGPLAGVVVSSMALALGAKLTLISDPATLPALPLDILRQSTLGGAIIDNVITGSLYVPEGAPTAGITIPLHPFAVAGYVGLIVNALALLPVGSKFIGLADVAGVAVSIFPFEFLIHALSLLSYFALATDGGRLTMALFDRAEKMSIGTLTLSALLFGGLFGSDLFLFYYSFCLAFQTGNEVPARNEQDSVDFSRIFVALVCYGLAILTLVPFQ